MLDIKDIIKNPEWYIEGLNKRNKNYKSIVNECVSLYKSKNIFLLKIEKLQETKNKNAELVAEHKKNNTNFEKIIKNSIEINKELETLKKDSQLIENNLNELLLSIPNVPRGTIKIGTTSDDNKVISVFGDIPEFKFPIKDHLELLLKNNMVNFEQGIKITGNKFITYQNSGAKLVRDLTNIFLNHNIENSFIEMNTPSIVNENSLLTTSQLPKFLNDLYKLDNDFYLSSTGEIQLINLYRNLILKHDTLPIRNTTFSKCFRKEAGAAGKDTKGLIRLHEFHKVEIISICELEFIDKEFKLMVETISSLLKKLKLPFRITELCTGDIGFSSSLTYDFEVWFPAQKRYIEVSSCSICETFQSRRGKIRYINKNNDKNFCGTLNGSSLAIDRIIAALAENFQDKDGNINLEFLQSI